ncbi:MAG: hypothetical protein JRD68_04325 [Deltaproteobacteria bacterium]|nr:hypothetical protein [Deltaproteobacteria bacterium]
MTRREAEDYYALQRFVRLSNAYTAISVRSADVRQVLNPYQPIERLRIVRF